MKSASPSSQVVRTRTWKPCSGSIPSKAVCCSRTATAPGRCWVDPELNTPQAIADGRVYFDFDFTPPYPAEHIVFRSHLVDDYLEETL